MMVTAIYRGDAFAVPKEKEPVSHANETICQCQPHQPQQPAHSILQKKQSLAIAKRLQNPKSLAIRRVPKHTPTQNPIRPTPEIAPTGRPEPCTPDIQIGRSDNTEQGAYRAETGFNDHSTIFGVGLRPKTPPMGRGTGAAGRGMHDSAVGGPIDGVRSPTLR